LAPVETPEEDSGDGVGVEVLVGGKEVEVGELAVDEIVVDEVVKVELKTDDDVGAVSTDKDLLDDDDYDDEEANDEDEEEEELMENLPSGV